MENGLSMLVNAERLFYNIGNFVPDIMGILWEDDVCAKIKYVAGNRTRCRNVFRHIFCCNTMLY